jgi:hypothetical protein
MLSHRTMERSSPHAENASNVIYFLTSQSLWVSGAILIGLGTALSMLGPGLVRRYVRLERLTANNEIAGFKYATLGVLYAVFLAFAIIVVWQKFSDAEADVVQEAGAATTIYRLSHGMDEKSGTEIRGAVTTYLKVAIADDWPAMDRGVTGASGSARQALDAIYTALLSSEPAERAGNPVMSELLHQLDVMTQARRARLIAPEGSLPGLNHMGGSVRRRRCGGRFHLFLWHAEFAGAGHDDGIARNDDLCRAAHYRRHRPAVHRIGEGGAHRAGRCAGRFRGRRRPALGRNRAHSGACPAWSGAAVCR